jgi:PKD repeat protein
VYIGCGWKKKELLFILIVLAFLVMPVSAGLMISSQGDKIVTRTGSASTVITVTDTDIPQDGNITIDISLPASVVANGFITDANVGVSDTAVDAIWTRQVEYDGSVFSLNLTSTNNATVAGETVTVTFTGAAAGDSAWYCDTGDKEFDLTAIRSDTLETSDPIIFLIYVTPGPGTLAITPGQTITTTNGNTSLLITVTDDPILQHDMIIIPVSDLDGYVTGGRLTNANVIVSDDAAAATWTGNVDANSILTLTSNGGETAINENVTINFTGTGPYPWKAGSVGNNLLQPYRPDSNAMADYNFAINIPPPAGYTIVPDFSAAPTTEIVPFTAAFTDLSLGHPTTWDWDWGDGTTHGSTRNPAHLYTTVGVYPVTLTASNAYSSNTVTKYQYIYALNGGFNQTDTTINGLTIVNCPGPQSVNVDTSILQADLIPDKYTLEIQPPAGKGLKNITLHAQNGVGFTRSANQITGNITGVHLESEDFSPPGGFSPAIGTQSSFNYSTDLPSYPCNAVITTKIAEGIIPPYDTKLQKIASGQTPVAVPIGTAYTATITKTNFPSGVPVRIHMSVNSGWNSLLSGGPGNVFIWKISDNGNTGQIFPTNPYYSDPVNNLDYYEADSPSGMSTFGLSSFTGNNNPFQLVTFAIAAYIEPQNPPAPVVNADNQGVTPTPTATPVPTATPTQNATMPSPDQTGSVSAKIYTNADGVITQATTLLSTDGFIMVSLGKGIVAKDKEGKPLSSISLTPVPEGKLPGALPGGTFSFAGRAYELQPDGAVFTPSILLIFSAPGDMKSGQEFAVKVFDHTSGTWKDVPSVYDARTGQVTAQVSSFCCFALFAKSITPEPMAAVPNAPLQRSDTQTAAIPPTAVGTAAGLFKWIVSLLAENSIIVMVVVILVAGFISYEWRQRRQHW